MWYSLISAQAWSAETLQNWCYLDGILSYCT